MNTKPATAALTIHPSTPSTTGVTTSCWVGDSVRLQWTANACWMHWNVANERFQSKLRHEGTFGQDTVDTFAALISQHGMPTQALLDALHDLNWSLSPSKEDGPARSRPDEAAKRAWMSAIKLA